MNTNRHQSESGAGDTEVEYLSDDSIGEAGDRELRALLTTCFTKPQDFVFKTQRYFREPYRHRWVIRDQQGAPIAHIGVHEKSIEVEGDTFQIGGICEVCVRPDHRGRGCVGSMLDYAHAWMRKHEIPFSMLFGAKGIYSSSGYREVENLFCNEDAKGWKPVDGMIREIMDSPWPTGEVHLIGLKF